MTLRLANTTTDPPVLLAQLQAFAAASGTTMPKLTLASVQRILNPVNPTTLCVVDTVTHAAVILDIDQAAHEIKVEWLHRGLTAAALKPLLKSVFVRGLARFPAASGWRVWAEFMWAKDANGVPDGGHAFCLAHQAQWPVTTVRCVGDPTNPQAQWIIESTLGALAA